MEYALINLFKRSFFIFWLFFALVIQAGEDGENLPLDIKEPVNKKITIHLPKSKPKIWHNYDIAKAHKKNPSLQAKILKKVPLRKIENYKEKDVDQLLIVAIKKNDARMVALLLVNGANPNKSDDSEQEAPLHIAYRNKNGQIILLLLAHKADPDVLNAKGYALLHYAYSHNDEKLINILLRHNADPKRLDIYGNAPEYYSMASKAARQGA